LTVGARGGYAGAYRSRELACGAVGARRVHARLCFELSCLTVVASPSPGRSRELAGQSAHVAAAEAPEALENLPAPHGTHALVLLVAR